MSQLQVRNGWSITKHIGDRRPDRTQRLLNHACWDIFAAMGVVRRFAVAHLEEQGSPDVPWQGERGGYRLRWPHCVQVTAGTAVALPLLLEACRELTATGPGEVAVAVRRAAGQVLSTGAPARVDVVCQHR